MRSATVKVLLALAANANAQLKMRPQASIQKVPYGFRVPQPRSNQPQSGVPFRFPAPERPNPVLNPRSHSAAVGVAAAGRAPPVVWASGSQNVYGESLDNCGSAGDCPYEESSPQICVGLAPRIRETGALVDFASARSFRLKKPEAQAGWSNDFPKQCISIWDFTTETGDDFLGWLTYGNSDLIPKCDALPADILTSSYSLEMWQGCELEAREYKYVSPASSKFAGDASQSEVTKKDPFVINKPSLGQETPSKFSAKCARFRDVIEGLCTTCGLQTSSDGAKTALSGMCAAMDSGSPAMAPKATGSKPKAGSQGSAKEWISNWRANMPSELVESNVSTSGDYFIPGLLALASTMLMVIGLKKLRNSRELALQDKVMLG